MYFPARIETTKFQECYCNNNCFTHCWFRYGGYRRLLNQRCILFPILRQVFLVFGQIIIKDLLCSVDVRDDRVEKQALQGFFT